jgi:multiple antibiotic resistance protein
MALTEALFYDFVALLVIVNPIQAAATFATLTYDVGADEQRRLARRASIAALAILLVFGFGGEALLKALGISFAAFRVAGGLLLLLVGFDMVFAKATSSSEPRATSGDDPSIFPLAIPMISGPGALTTMVALVSKRRESPLEIGLVVVLAVAVIAITFLAMRVSRRLTGFFGMSGVNAVSRIMGIIVASIAVQLIVNGLRELFPILARP